MNVKLDLQKKQLEAETATFKSRFDFIVIVDSVKAMIGGSSSRLKNQKLLKQHHLKCITCTNSSYTLTA